jgi:hypothetical protein
VHADATLVSRPVRSPRAFSADVSRASAAAHQAKLAGLYVGYEDGRVRLPGEITGAEAWQVIGQTQQMLDRDTGSRARRLADVQLLAAQPEAVRVTWVIFLAWAAATEMDTVAAMVRDGGSAEATTELMLRFFERIGAAGRLPDPFALLELRRPGTL